MKKYLHALSMHWQMKTLLRRVLEDKKEERSNIFSSLKDVKQVQRNQKVCLERMDAQLTHIKFHLQCDPNPQAPPR